MKNYRHDFYRRLHLLPPNWRGLAILIGIFLLLCGKNCLAVTLDKNQGIDAGVPLMAGVSYFSDNSKSITLDDILAEPGNFNFKPAPSIFSEHDATLWLKLALSPKEGTPGDWVIQFSPAWLDEVRVYVPDENGQNHAIFTLGDQYRLDERKTAASQIAFPMSGITSEKTIYMRISSHGSMPLRLQAWQPKGFERYEIRRAGIYLFFAGGASVMILLAFLFWMWTRAAVYFWNFLFLTSTALAVYIAQGYGNVVLFPGSATLSDRFTDAVVYAFMFSSQAFTGALFNYRQHYKRIARILDGVVAALIALCVLAMLGISGPIIWYVQVLGLALGAANMWLVIRLLYLHGTRDHIFVAVPFFIQSVSWGIYMIMKTGVVHLDYSPSIETIAFYAQLIFFLLLNAAIAWRAGDVKFELIDEKIRRENFANAAAAAIEEKRKQGEFVAVVSHEIRSPLNAVDAICHALSISSADKKDQAMESIKKIRGIVKRISNLVDNILLSGALEADLKPKVEESIDLNALVRKVLAVETYGSESRYELRECNAQAALRGDHSALEISFSNIFQNAIKYSNSESVVVVSCSIWDRIFLIDVRSTGRPIPLEEQALLFDPYFRGGNSSHVRGTGLGLHIAQTIARQHGGDVALISSTVEATVFQLSLPVVVRSLAQPEAGGRYPQAPLVSALDSADY